MPTPDAVTTVGRYSLLSRVGEGGMGVVFLGQDPGGQQVAVKLLRPHVVSDEFGRARMAREVTSLRRVRSPRVAEVYDADPWGETPYLVTRFVPGPSLHDRVRHGGPLQGRDLETLAGGLAQALVAVHAADVLHRDVKPSNVLLEPGGPVLIDFGLAQLADDSRITYSGWLLGTPGYLAPEILFGEDPTPLADVHSWAATVVYAASGRGPYGNGPAVAVMDRVRRGEHDLSGIPNELYWVVRQALSADPRDRPSSSQLADWLAGDLVGAASGGTALRPGRVSRPATLTSASTPATAPAPVTRPPVPPPAPRRSATLAPTLAPRTALPWSPSPAVAAASATALPWGPSPVVAATWVPPAPQSAPAASAPRSSAQTSASGPVPWPVERRRPSALVSWLLWCGVTCLLMAVAVTAPGILACTLIIGSWVLRTVSVRAERLWRWRVRRGPRRHDGVLATVCTPWFGVLALPGVALNAGFALLGGGAFVVFATLMLSPRTLVYVLGAGTVLACLLAWWGPASGRVRAGGRTVSAALLQPGMTTLLVFSTIIAAGVAVLLIRQVAGPLYAPFPSPPWRHDLREFLPHA